MDSNETTNEIVSKTSGKHSARRWKMLGVVALSIAAVALLLFWGLTSRNHETTEDAFVDGNVVAVTAQVGGVVTAIDADNTDYVSAGSRMVQLDDVDARLALSHAEATLAKAVRQVRAQYAAVGQGRANLELRQIDLGKARADLARRLRLQASGAISGEEVKHARDAAHAAAAAMNMARQQLAASSALVDRSTIESNPQVLEAAAQLRGAYVAVYRTAVPAPVSGVVTKRNVQLGQKITPGVALMSVVPLDHLWVNANFKESQLRHIHIGQPVRLVSDVYGSAVVYDGTVVGQDAGTGSAFSLLPAQNATGNWIKVVQRVPVRIALEPKQVAAHPLQLGLSMHVSVDTSQRGGRRLVSVGGRDHGYATDVFSHELASADDRVRKIIKANQ